MTLREKVAAAIKAFESQSFSELRNILKEIENQLNSIGNIDPENHPIAVCCFSINKEGMVSCGDEHEIFSGTLEQRKLFCMGCFNFCKREFEDLKMKLAKPALR